MRNDILKKPLHLSLQLSDCEDNGSPKNKISPEIPHREKEKPKNWYPVRGGTRLSGRDYTQSVSLPDHPAGQTRAKTVMGQCRAGQHLELDS